MAQEAHIAKLKQGVVAWNEWRNQEPGVVPDLSDADLSGIRLKPLDDVDDREAAAYQMASGYLPYSNGANLQNARFRNTKLRRSYLRAANFSNADLNGADLSEADASAACFDGSLLRGATLDEARLQQATFNTADLEGAKFAHAYLYKAEFKEARARAANFSASVLSVAKFDNAILVGAKFAGARLVETSFHNAYMSFADLRHAVAKEAFFRGANLYHAYISDAELREAVLERANLRETDIQRAKLGEANLKFADLGNANLTGADLHEAELQSASLSGTQLTGVNLRRAKLERADLRSANLRQAVLTEASLRGSLLMNASLDGADLSSCRVFGISAWDVSLKGAIQKDLVFTPDGEPAATVDDLEFAQFVYLLSSNGKIRKLLDTATQKVVLVLGRFTPPRLAVLNAIRNELRKRNYLPVVFTFEPSPSRNLTETVATLASLVRFVVADISSPKSVPQEMLAIAEQFVSVPIQPIILSSQKPYALFESIQERQSVLPLYRYSSVTALRHAFTAKVVTPAELFASQVVAKRLASGKRSRR